jgi:hypothetical protein
MFALYRRTVALAFQRAARAWPVAFSLVLYGLVMYVGALFLAPLGMVGGILLSLVFAACLSGYLHLLSQAVMGSKVTLADLQQGFAARFWDVVSVLFAFWLISLLVGLFVRGAGDAGAAINAMVGLAMAFFFNAVPELLYLGQSRSFALLGDSARFVLKEPLTWFLPNLLLAALLLAPSGLLRVDRPGELLLVFSSVFSPSGLLRVVAALPPWSWPLLLLFLHFVMVFRGLLFLELESGNARQRAFRARMGGSAR